MMRNIGPLSNSRCSRQRFLQQIQGECSGANVEPKLSEQFRAWNEDILSLISFCYVDLKLVKAVVIGSVAPMMLQRMPGVPSLKPLADNLGGLVVWCAEVFEAAALIAEPCTDDVLKSGGDFPGGLLSVAHSFRTKGVGCWDGNDWRIGHIYRRTHGITLNLTIDPHWVFPGHGWSELCKGHATLGGLFIVESVNEAARTIIGRPVILGNLATPLTAAVLNQHGYPICRKPTGSTTR